MSARAAMLPCVLTADVRSEEEVVSARQRARRVAELIGFDAQERTRIATMVSEIVRNAFRYAGGGTVTFSVEGEAGAQQLVVRVTDHGAGIADLDAVLEGRFRSTTGMGLGLIGARRLADSFSVDTAPGRGTTVTLGRSLPRRPPVVVSPEQLAAIADTLSRDDPRTPFEELQAQNRELLETLDALRLRQAEVERLNRELDETNRGVLALYAELDDRAEALRRASAHKSGFLNDVSHELRTPLTSIVNLSRMLADHPGREFGDEQRTAVQFIRRSAESLTEIVNDLLDLAKIEAGHITVRPAEFTVRDLFAAMRGMFRPLVTNEAVTLHFDAAESMPPLVTDEGRLSQILRNLVSNALKYTEAGEVRVSAALVADDTVLFRVQDSGVGIAPEDQARIFQEFVQVEGPHQRRVRGTGLGLPLSQRLARLLGGMVTVESTPGVGSTFAVCIPRVLAPQHEDRGATAGPEGDAHD